MQGLRTGRIAELKMLTRQERRFVRNWEEQRKGSRAGYYLLYICIWFFVSMLGLFFLFAHFTEMYRNKLQTLYEMMAAATVLAIITTHLTYQRNEKRFKKIIRREMDDAKQ